MFLKNISRSIAKLYSSLPLRLALTVPFVLQTVAAVSLVGYLSFINGQKAVQELVNSLEGEISDRIQDHLKNYLEKPHTIARLNAATAQLGKLHPADLPATQRYFWQQMQIFSSVREIYLGSKEGQFIGVRREPSGQLVTKITENFPQRSCYALDAEGNPTNLLSFEPKYDPRTRPWYISATAAQQISLD